MYKNNNNKHLKLLFRRKICFFTLIYFVNFICFSQQNTDDNNIKNMTHDNEKKSFYKNKKNNILLSKKLSFKSNGEFFKDLQAVCANNNINIAITAAENNNKKVFCNFQNITLKDILAISLSEAEFNLEEINDFIVIRDQKEVICTYYLNNQLSDKQLNNLNKFLEIFTKNVNGKYTFNSDDGTIIFTGLPVYQERIKEYICNINRKYNQQIMFECKIINIQNNKSNNNNLNLLKCIQNLLSVSIPINLWNLSKGLFTNIVFFSDLDSIVRFLSCIYETTNIHNIKMMMCNGQVCYFNTQECRYLDKYYDTSLIETEDILHLHNTKEKKDKDHNHKKALIRSLKQFNGGINLSIIPTIRNKDVMLQITYTQSSFQDGNKTLLPITITNGFTSLIKVKYNEIVTINGLHNTIKKKIKKNISKYKFLNFLFGQEEFVEVECQILFLIKIYNI